MAPHPWLPHPQKRHLGEDLAFFLEGGPPALTALLREIELAADRPLLVQAAQQRVRAERLRAALRVTLSQHVTLSRVNAGLRAELQAARDALEVARSPPVTAVPTHVVDVAVQESEPDGVPVPVPASVVPGPEEEEGRQPPATLIFEDHPDGSPGPGPSAEVPPAESLPRDRRGSAATEPPDSHQVGGPAIGVLRSGSSLFSGPDQGGLPSFSAGFGAGGPRGETALGAGAGAGSVRSRGTSATGAPAAHAKRQQPSSSPTPPTSSPTPSPSPADVSASAEQVPPPATAPLPEPPVLLSLTSQDLHRSWAAHGQSASLEGEGGAGEEGALATFEDGPDWTLLLVSPSPGVRSMHKS